MAIVKEKEKICKKILEMAEKARDDIKKSQKGAQERANEAEGAMVSRYDTFKEEGQYLAYGLKLRLNELISEVEITKDIISNTPLRENKTVQIATFVTVELESGVEKRFFIFPAMGGSKIGKNTIITPSSPIGKALFNKEEGETFQLLLSGKKTEGEIVEIK